MGSAEELKTQYLQAQSQGHRIINCLEERGIERKQISLLSKDVKSHHQSDQRLKVFVLRTTVEKLVRDRVELGSHRHHLGLN